MGVNITSPGFASLVVSTNQNAIKKYYVYNKYYPICAVILSGEQQYKAT